MKIRAVLFDIYNTLLQVSPPPADAEERWARLWRAQLAGSPRLSLAEFSAGCQRVIASEHAAAKARGIAVPEVFWPAVASTVLPELGALPPPDQDDFLYQHAALCHAVHLMPGALETLHRLMAAKVLLGIASNCQPYTLRELTTELGAAGLAMAIFHPDLCFFSYQAGFSKPDPHVFQLLTARLQGLGIAPQDTLLVGDRTDKDVVPARAFGWQTWLLQEDAAARPETGGNWLQLARWLG